jgi:hypothetical protein
MKSRIGLLAIVALLAGAVFSQQTPIDGRVTVEWDYPSNDVPTMTFNVYHSTNISLPVANWPKLASVQGATRVPLTVTPGPNYFVCTASNFWGESDFSNVASTPGTPRSDINLKVRKGH